VPISWWFCCLNDAEKGVILATEDGFLATLFQGIPVAVWNAFWLPWPYTGEARRVAFRVIFGLEIATIDSDGVPLDVVRPASGMIGQWLEWELYLETPAAACVDGCQQSRPSWRD